eukprot:12714851-Ditylum_brightwellii.AAC.1
MLYLHELHMLRSFDKQVDQMMCSEDFFKFGMGEVPQYCVSIPVINMENAKQVAIFSDSCKGIILDTGATRAETICINDFISFKCCHKKKKVMKSIVKGLKIKGSGTFEYQFNVDEGSDSGTSAGNPIKFSTISPFCSKKVYAQLEVMPSANGWED